MAYQPVIKLTRGLRKGEAIVRIEFPYNKELVEAVKQKTTAAWSAGLACWFGTHHIEQGVDMGSSRNGWGMKAKTNRGIYVPGKYIQPLCPSLKQTQLI